MADRRRLPPAARSERDQRRRSFGQNFLVDRGLVRRLVSTMAIAPGELVVDIGAGRGALSFACADAGARVVAIERDPVWAHRLRDDIAHRGLAAAIDVAAADALDWPLPRATFRVIANPPFAITTQLLARLLDDPVLGPHRCDLILQVDVVRTRAQTPPDTLRSAAWAPWWTFEAGPVIPRSAFRPIPGVDAAMLTIRRRQDPVLPTWLAPRFAETLRHGWDHRR